MPSLSPIEIARSYIDRGWSPLPVPFRTKRPVLKAWEQLRVDDETIADHFNGKPMNIGVLLGEPSNGLVDIDLDCPEAVAIADRFLPKTDAVFGRRSRPRSHRLYVVGRPGDGFRLKEPEKDESGKQATLIEYRATGEQTIFPGSVHESGEPIEWENDQPYHVENAADLQAAVRRVGAACLLARHWPGSGGRHDARLAIAGGLARAGWALEDVTHFVHAIESVVPHQAKDAIKDAAAAVKTSFERLTVDGKATGWPTLDRIVGGSVVRTVRDWLDIEYQLEMEEAEAVELDRPAFPAHLLQPPGKVGAIVAWINATAIKPQPVFALANALAFWGAVVGRMVAFDRARTNLYTLGVGASGCGKDWSRHAIKHICDAAGTIDLLGGEDIASDTALQKVVAKQKSVLFQIDEIGHFFSNLSNRNAGTHQRSIAPTFTKLFSSASTTFKGKEFANGDCIVADQPNACLYGTTVPETLYGGMSPAEVSDGFLARLLVFRTSDQDPPRTQNRYFDPPEDVVEAIVNWRHRNDLPRAVGNVAGAIRHIPIPVDADAEARAEFARLEAFASEMKAKHRDGSGLDSLWARATEHASKVALIVASGCGFSRDELRITGDIAAYACELVRFVVGELVQAIQESVAGSEVERDIQRVLKAIKSAGLGGCSRSELLRRTQRLGMRQRDEAIRYLLETQKIGQREEKPARGPTSIRYYIAKPVEKRLCA